MIQRSPEGQRVEASTWPSNLETLLPKYASFRTMMLGRIVGGIVALTCLSLTTMPFLPAHPPAPQVVKWHIGKIDPRFKLSSAQAIQSAKRATALWESATDRQLFQYDPDAGLTVNFVFDARHRRTLERKSAEANLKALEADVTRLRAQHRAAKAQYEADRDGFERQKGQHESAVSDYNRQVEYWNSNGGAADEARAELGRERTRLESRRRKLDELLTALDESRFRSNALVDRLNQAVTAYNDGVRLFNQQFGSKTKHVAGECLTRGSRALRINIYTYEDLNHLSVVLAHEFGHALGVQHVNKPNCLMSPVEDGGNNAAVLRLTTDDLASLRRALGSR